VLALAIALLLPNVPQIFRYREYRRAPDSTSLVCWKPTVIWSIAVGLAFAIALFGMWQRMEFLYFQF
jgi:alginate O-acetyltransferase complex protein AlgI